MAETQAASHVLRGLLIVAMSLQGGCDLAFGLDGGGRFTQVRFDNSESNTDLVDFPVLVSIDASVVDYAKVDDPLTDLRFVDPATSAELPFEIDHWDPAGESSLWVRVPKIRAGSVADEILMQVGTNVATTTPVAADVWRGSYELVSHLQAVSPTIPDVLGMHAGTPENVTVTQGRVGAGLAFGVNSRVTFANTLAVLEGWQEFTVELWIDPDYPSVSALVGEPAVMGKREPLTNCRLIPTGEFQCDVTFQSVETAYLNAQVIDRPPDRPWSYLVYTSDGVTLRLYQDGVLESDAPAGTLASSAMRRPLVLGDPDQPTSFVGKLDELRLSQVGRSGDWVRAQYLAVSGSFVRFK